MIFETHSLGASFSPYIESIFHFKGFVPDHSIERVVPTGHLFIIFELDGIPRHTYDNATLQPNARYEKAWISGMHRDYLSISAHQDSEMFVIQFKPHGAFPFLHRPVSELNEQVVPAEAVLGAGCLKLREDILPLATSQEKFALAEQWLTDRFDAEKTPPADLMTVLQRLRSEPATQYAEIIDAYPKTQKHLIDQFKKYVGLTPKFLHRILRFNEILQVIRNKETIAWPQVAYQCGFSDQSHFIKEFKRFSGFNPQEFIRQEFHQDEPNFFPLDREG